MLGNAARARRCPAIAACLALLLAACSGGSNHSNNLADTAPGDTSAPARTPSSTGPRATYLPGPTTTKPKPSSTTRPHVVPFSPKVLALTIPASIRHDCSADVSTSIQSWIDSVPDNVVLSLIRDGCYRADATIFLRRRRHMAIDGNGATLKAVTVGDRTRQELVLLGGDNLAVRNLTVRGANPTAGASHSAYHAGLEAQHAFQVSGATDVVLDHVQAYDLYGDFVYVGPDGDKPSQNVTISNSTFQRSGRQGISVTDAVNVTIMANTIGGVARSLFDIEPNAVTQTARSIRIIGNTTGAATNFWLADKGAAASIGDIQISDNRMVAGTGGLIFVFAPGGPYRGPFQITNNRFIVGDTVHDEGSSGALFFAHAQNVTISGNQVTFPRGRGMPAVELRDSRQVRLRSNIFTNGGRLVLTTGGTSDFDAS